MERLAYLMQRDPTIAQRMAAVEAQTRGYIQQLQTLPHLRTGSVITIPVVVHIVYRTSAENVSDAQVQSQIDVLNEDFRRQNTDVANTPSLFASLTADVEVQFCLATRDPQGNPTTGITRTQTTKTSFDIYSDDVKYSSRGGKDAWPTDQYLNIWVCNLSGGLLGYAQFPGGGSAAEDGVVINYRYFGRGGSAQAPFNKGRTATHEVGHWLNLRHIWGDAQCGDDYVADTPPQEGPNYGCPTFPHPSCGNTSDMFMNYMDYGDDHCLVMFTQGQKNRMRAVLSPTGYRAGLLSSPGCTAPGSCSGTITLTATSGSISDGSGNYTDNADCRWVIQPPGATSITLSFQSFNLLPGDSVIIYDGATISSPRLGAYSGTSLPPNLTSSGGAMLVRLKTNGSGTAAGFQATYTVQAPTLCGGTQLLTQSSGTFSDGSGSNNYRNDADCRWIIRPGQGTGIRIEFSQFKTEANYDFVTIYDGGQVNSRVMVRRFSGSNLPPVVTTSVPEATVYFTTDGSVTDEGWNLSYTTLNTPYCSGTAVITAPSGTISDGSGVSDYTNRTNCRWLIQPVGATYVTLTFSAFRTERGYDFVRIYDGTTTSAPLIGSYSGDSLPMPITANSGKMLIVFTSDSSITRAGWQASYTSDGAATALFHENPVSGIRFYPVPAREALWISLPAGEPAEVSIYDTDGRVVWQNTVQAGETAIPLTTWPSGLYLALVRRDGHTVSFRFLHE